MKYVYIYMMGSNSNSKIQMFPKKRITTKEHQSEMITLPVDQWVTIGKNTKEEQRQLFNKKSSTMYLYATS